MELDKNFDAARAEKRIYEMWEKSGCFKAGANKSRDDSFCIMLPPPNVTGTLHMGHAFQHTIIDILIRYNRMLGKSVLWQPGTDHAGIATQLVVENNLIKEDLERKEMGREKFLDEVWKWKNFSENKIQSQIKRLGCSVDWTKYRFTLDEKFSSTVNKAFVDLYRNKKIYRGYRLVNWDPSLKTAVSDLEVVRQVKNGLIWHLSLIHI
mgnify:CR=1 FL=1